MGLKIILFVLALFACPLAVAQNRGISDSPYNSFASPPAAIQDDNADKYPFRIDEYRSSQRVRFVAVNNSPGAITVFFDLIGSNFNLDKELPTTLVISPKSSQEIVQVTPTTRWEPLRLSYRHSFQPGDAFTLPDRHARYILPFQKGAPFLVVQSPDSRRGTGTIITHDNDHSRHAYDFGVSEGTLVTAARDGVVINIRDTFIAGSPDPTLSDKANFVTIMHADRTIASYLHLAPQSVLVSPGQHVRAGTAIAYSGNTGYSHGPHLHFDVRRAAVSENGVVVHLSVPVDFYQRDGAGEKILIRDGMLIKAQ